MFFRFFRPWEDGGQGNTLQTADGRQKVSSEPSKTPTSPNVLSVRTEQHAVHSQESTRSVQALSAIPGPLNQQEEAHRAEKEDVWNASKLDAPSSVTLALPLGHLSAMYFRFFRPWEDGGQGNTHQTADRRQKVSSEPSKTPTPPHVLSFRTEQRVVPLQEATRSVQALSAIPGPLLQQEEAHRTEKEGVWNASTLDAPSVENLLVSQDQVFRQTSASGSIENAGSASKDPVCTNNESENYARHNINHSWKSSCLTDKHSSEAHFFSALQNDTSLQVSTADESLMPGKNVNTLNSLVGSGSCGTENDVQSKATPDMSADVTKSRLEMNCSKFAADSSKLDKQDLQSPAIALTEECCIDTFSDARQEHCQMESKSFQCKICGKCFAQPSNMHQHEKIHTESKPSQQVSCDKTYSRLDYLQTQKAINARSKPYQCTLCEKAFSYPRNLHMHKRIHTGFKPFKCSFCKKAFAQSNSLHKHERIHTGSKPFKCSVCKKAFTQSNHLHRHDRIHTGSKPFKCSVCEKAFTQSSNLLAHERIHTGSKPFKCSVCEKAFTWSSNLHAHKRIHTRSEPFKCSFCEKAFTGSSTLCKHERLHRI